MTNLHQNDEQNEKWNRALKELIDFQKSLESLTDGEEEDNELLLDKIYRKLDKIYRKFLDMF